MLRLRSAFPVALLAAAYCLSSSGQTKLTSRTLTYGQGKSIRLSLPTGLDINVAASGLRRVRFFAQAPDGRIFATGMDNLADNTRGTVYILDGWDEASHTFKHVIPYLQHLRNPNNLAFYTDSSKQSWLYLPLTSRLVRYKYNAGDNAPSSPPQTLVRFPDYGLSYKYGGWHLTRTVAVATVRGRTRVYVAAGSSCNYCKESEAQRASLMAMDPDGSRLQIVAHGLRNAVDVRWVNGIDGGALFATNMGDDHLGDKLPEDTFFELDSNRKRGPIAAVAYGTPTTVNYGWPTCYFANGKAVHDETKLPETHGPDSPYENAPKPAEKSTADDDSVYGEQGASAQAGVNLAAQARVQKGLPNLGAAPEPLASCDQVPAAYTTFAAHSSPLGLAYFAQDNTLLANSFLVALHGSGHTRIGTGYRLVRFTANDRTPQDFMTGFLAQVNGKPFVHGRPCGLLRLGPDTFLLTDDYLGLIYYIHPKA